MELMGGLLDEETFNENSEGNYENKGSKYFENYWNKCFCNYDEKYKIENVTKLVRNLIRHGLAHNFLTKPDIFIVKSKKEYHWKIDKTDNFLSISCLDFYNDFKNSYYKFFIKEIEKNKERTQERLREMFEKYSAESRKLFDKINFEDSKEEVNNSVNIDRTIGSPAAKLKEFFFTGRDASGTPMSATPSGISENFPIFKEEYFSDKENNE